MALIPCSNSNCPNMYLETKCTCPQCGYPNYIRYGDDAEVLHAVRRTCHEIDMHKLRCEELRLIAQQNFLYFCVLIAVAFFTGFLWYIIR